MVELFLHWLGRGKNNIVFFFMTIMLKLCIPCFYLKFWIKALLLLDSSFFVFFTTFRLLYIFLSCRSYHENFKNCLTEHFIRWWVGFFLLYLTSFFVIITFLQRCILALLIQGIERIAFKKNKIKFRLLTNRLHPIWHVNSVLLKR